MRILHISPSFYPAVRYGGPIFIADSLTRALAALGHDVHVYATNVDGPYASRVSIGAPINRDGVKITYFPPDWGRRVYRSTALGAAVHADIANFDIIHLHAVFTWTTVIGARAARRRNVPYVLTPYGMLIKDLINRKSRWIKHGWLELFDRANLAHAAAVHVASEIEATEFQALGLKAKRLAQVPYSVDLPELSSSRQASRQSRDAQGGRPTILFLSRVNWKKGLDRLIRAVALTPDVDLVIAGNDEENYTPEMQRLAASVGISNRTSFVGPVHDDRKWELLKSATIFALPSYSENFAVAVLEAMAAGCPVVVTHEVGMAKSVERHGAGIVVDGDPEKIAAAFRRLLTDVHLRRAMSGAAPQAVRDHFTAEAVARRMEHVYGECLQPSAGYLGNLPSLSSVQISDT